MSKLPAASILLILAPALGAKEPGTVEFAGEVSNGDEFRKAISTDLDFVLVPDEGGWTVEIEPRHQTGAAGCANFASVATPPFHFFNQRYISPGYEYDAAAAVKLSPREFFFVTTVEDCLRTGNAADILSHPGSFSKPEVAQADRDFDRKPFGAGRLWILDSKTSSCGRCGGDDKPMEGERIEWLRFKVEIHMPPAKRPGKQAAARFAPHSHWACGSSPDLPPDRAQQRGPKEQAAAGNAKPSPAAFFSPAIPAHSRAAPEPEPGTSRARNAS